MQSLPEVDFEPGTAVICDLHLDLGREDPSADFEALLSSLHGIPRLVILGDLFDYWVGPAQLRLPGAPRILDALAALTKSGAKLDVLFGNRDFLLGRSFAERTGAVLRPEGLVGRLPGGARSLLIHGDQLCTKDVGYQRLRCVLRSRFIQGLAPHLPLWVSERLAKRLRRASTAAIQAKPSEEKSIQATAALDWSSRSCVQEVICGHAHEYRDETLGNGSRLRVLDALGGAKDLLVLTSTEWEVRSSQDRVKLPRR